jgi:hypothetical protein
MIIQNLSGLFRLIVRGQLGYVIQFQQHLDRSGEGWIMLKSNCESTPH